MLAESFFLGYTVFYARYIGKELFLWVARIIAIAARLTAAAKRASRLQPIRRPLLKKVIGVVSGKGGVGKSLLTSMMAVGMTRKGYSCGVLDADITGPSIPKTFGVHGQLEGCEEGILPARSAGGVQMISINLVLPHEDDPVIYRGPIIAETVKQFWSDVVWDDVDFLFVDMPPGTGDVPLTVFQSLPVDGIIIVTSPQELVSMIVGKAVKMAKMMNIPVLGIVENYLSGMPGLRQAAFRYSARATSTRWPRTTSCRFWPSCRSTRSWLRRLTQARSRMQSCRTSFPVRLRPWRVCYEHWRSI